MMNLATHAIAARGVLIVAQIVGNAMLNYWRAQGDAYSTPDPMFKKIGGKR